jgi:hypothetical protein
MVTTSANEKTIPVFAPPTPKIDNNLSPDYDNSEHSSTGRSLFDRLSSIHQIDARRICILLSNSRSPPPPLATNAKQQLEHAVEEESADLRSQMYQVMGGFRLQLDAQLARQQAIESEQSGAMAAQAASITALPHLHLHVEDKTVAGQQAVTPLHAQFEQASEQAAQSSREQSQQIASIIDMLGAANAPASPTPETVALQDVTATAASAAELVAPPPPVVVGSIQYPFTANPSYVEALRNRLEADPAQVLFPNFVLPQDRTLHSTPTRLFHRIREVGGSTLAASPTR